MTQEEFIRALFGHTENNVHFESLGNERDGPHPRRILDTRDLQSLGDFHRQWDKPGRGLFFCVGTLRPGTDRRKENVAEIAALHSDMDFKDIADLPDVILRKLREWQRMPPSIIVRSGNGYHGYWLLTEATTDFDRIEAVLRLLADITGGDPSVCEISRLMRLPGSHNSKGGAWKEVEIVLFEPTRLYELDDIEEALRETKPMIERKAKDGTAAPRLVDTNPFLEAAREGGFKPPLDVEQMLADMTVGNIHDTQIRVAASLMEKGQHSVEEIVNILMTRTREVVGPDARWNWQKEERNIRASCDTWAKKHPQPAAVSAGSGTVVNMAEVRRQKAEAQKAGKAPPKDKEKADVPSLVVEGVIKVIRADGRDIFLHDGDVWFYRDGCWHIMTPGEEQWIDVLIQEGFRTLNVPAKLGAVSQAKKGVTTHPDLHKVHVPWADGELVVCQNGALRISDRSFSAHAPEHYARRKIGAPYEPDAACPMFLDLLGRMFADKGEEAPGYVQLIQEAAGAGLAVSRLSREVRKAMLLAGASRTGKTVLAGILGDIYGGPIVSATVAGIGGNFGMENFVGASAWICDDAINEGDKLDPQRFKVVVTGEPIEIARKNKIGLRVSLHLPVWLTTNSLPRARDKTDAIFNRCMVVEMNNVVSDGDAKALRRQLGVPAGHTIGSFIFEREAAGILNWMLAGLDALLARGAYAPPQGVVAAIQRFKDDNNPVHEWSKGALEKDPHSKVERSDLMVAYHVWRREQYGDEEKAGGMKQFLPGLRAAVPYGREMQGSNSRRYMEGVRLTEEGLHQWDQARLAPLKTGYQGSSDTRHQVNGIVNQQYNRKAKF